MPLAPESVHQGAALEVKPLKWGSLSEVALREAPGETRPLLVALDRVTDPHNIGAILRSAEVFGARAVIAPARHSAPETGALAKTASGALERQPYLRVPNLAEALSQLKNMGFIADRAGRDRRGHAARGAGGAAGAGDLPGAGRRGTGDARADNENLRPGRRGFPLPPISAR